MEEGKIGELDSKVLLRKDTIRDVNYFLSKNWITEEEVYKTVKKFLKRYLKIDYEFTKDELFEELKNMYLPYTIRSDFFNFVDKIFLFEYADVKYTEDELRVLLTEFKGYLDYLLIPSFVEKSVNVILLKSIKTKLHDYLRSLLLRQGASKNKVKTKIEETIDVSNQPTSLVPIDEALESHIDLNSLIEKIYLSLDNDDVPSAAMLYKSAMSKYQFLTADEKIAYYERLMVLYDLINKSDSE